MSNKDALLKELASLVANELEQTPYESMSRLLGDYIIRDSHFNSKTNMWELTVEKDKKKYKLILYADILTKI